MNNLNENKPILSIVLIIKDFFHLASLSLESVFKQTLENYEVIVVEASKNKKELIMIKPYLNKISKIIHADTKNITSLLNMGFKNSNGQYIHYLSAGDTYISKYVLSYLSFLISKEHIPDLICCAFLQRDEMGLPQAVNFSFEYFKRGKIPMHIQSLWFSRNILNKLKGFDSGYKVQAGFDAICKIFLKKDKRVLFSTRVLTDYQFKKRTSHFYLLKAYENLKIIYRNFGFFKTIYWWIVHDHFRMFKLFLHSLKKAFWQS